MLSAEVQYTIVFPGTTGMHKKVDYCASEVTGKVYFFLMKSGLSL